MWKAEMCVTETERNKMVKMKEEENHAKYQR